MSTTIEDQIAAVSAELALRRARIPDLIRQCRYTVAQAVATVTPIEAALGTLCAVQSLANAANYQHDAVIKMLHDFRQLALDYPTEADTADLRIPDDPAS